MKTQTTQNPSCFAGNSSRVYFQYMCQQTKETLDRKRVEGLIVTCAGLLVAATFYILIEYLQKTSDVDFKIWDVETVTASDFTVDFDIDERQWTQFQKLHYTKYKQEGGSLLLAFELYIRDEIEKLVEKSSGRREGS